MATTSELIPIQNPWGHTLMPSYFREYILVIMIMNGVATSTWEYFFVNGFIGKWVQSFFPKQDLLYGGIGYCGKGEDSFAGTVVELAELSQRYEKLKQENVDPVEP